MDVINIPWKAIVSSYETVEDTVNYFTYTVNIVRLVAFHSSYIQSIQDLLQTQQKSDSDLRPISTYVRISHANLLFPVHIRTFARRKTVGYGLGTISSHAK